MRSNLDVPTLLRPPPMLAGIPAAWGLALALAASACGDGAPAEALELDLGGYALVDAPAGFYFFPPVAPEPSYTGSFDGSRLADLEVAIEATPASGDPSTVATFGAGSRPAVFLKADVERYLLNLRLADYFTDRGASYRFVVRFRGAVLATADMPGAVFDFIDRNPEMSMTLRFRIEPAALDRDGDGVLDPDDHCPDHADASNPIPSEEACDGVDNNCDGEVDEGNPGGGEPCSTGLAGVCAAGATTCSGGALACVGAQAPSPELCDGADNNCDGATDEGCLPDSAACLSVQQGTPGATSGVHTVDLDGTGPTAPMSVYCDMSTDGGGWTLVMRVVNGYHTGTGEVAATSLPGRATHAKLADATIRSIALAGQREALITDGSTRYIVRYSDAEWSTYASNGWTNVAYDSKSASGVWSNNVCNGHWNNRGFSTWTDVGYQTCPVVYAGPRAYLTQYHTYLYGGGVGGVFEVYVR